MSGFDTRPARVWIVDDSVADAQRAASVLAPRRAVEVFGDGSAVLERIAACGPPEALVLDWVMPGVSGLEVIQFLRALGGQAAAVPILLLTARGRPEQIREGLDAGANDYLAKPFAPEELTARIDALLRTAALLARAISAEQGVRELLAASPDALLAFDERGAISFANREAARMFARDEAAMVGLPCGAVLEDSSCERLIASADAAEVADLVLGERTYAPTVSRMPAGDIRTVIALRDVTERRRLEARRLDLYSIVAHDLRTPLGAMVLRTQVMLDGQRGALAAPVRGDLERIAASCASMVGIIDDFLAIAQLDAVPTVEREPVDLGDVIRAVLDDLAPLAEAKRVALDFRRPVQPLEVVGDRARLGQVVANLVGNAIKFAPAETTVDVFGAPLDATVEIAVADAGPGVPAAAIATLFDRFTRAGDRRAVAGTGLGLMIVRQIVEAHRGEVGVDTVLGEGSRFWFRLPRLRPCASASSAASPAVSPA